MSTLTLNSYIPIISHPNWRIPPCSYHQAIETLVECNYRIYSFGVPGGYKSYCDGIGAQRFWSRHHEFPTKICFPKGLSRVSPISGSFGQDSDLILMATNLQTKPHWWQENPHFRMDTIVIMVDSHLNGMKSLLNTKHWTHLSPHMDTIHLMVKVHSHSNTKQQVGALRGQLGDVLGGAKVELWGKSVGKWWEKTHEWCWLGIAVPQ